MKRDTKKRIRRFVLRRQSDKMYVLSPAEGESERKREKVVKNNKITFSVVFFFQLDEKETRQDYESDVK